MSRSQKSGGQYLEVRAGSQWAEVRTKESVLGDSNVAVRDWESRAGNQCLRARLSESGLGVQSQSDGIGLSGFSDQWFRAI